MIVLMISICYFVVPNAFSQVPNDIAGFSLGKNIKDYENKLRLNTIFPIRYAEFLKEVEIKSIPGYKTGLITYGDCAVPGRIIRIRLKYEDSSREFYNNLLDRFKKRFGKPDRWRGDPFHVLVAWKWSFTDTNGNRISMILQHNIEDTTKKLGNVIKLAVLDFEEEEIRCYEKLQVDEKSPQELQQPARKAVPDWDLFIPR